MFNTARVFNVNLSKWCVSSVTKMDGMFASAEAFNVNLSQWKVDNVFSLAKMFRNAKAFDQSLCWNLSKVSYQHHLFTGAKGGRIRC